MKVFISYRRDDTGAMAGRIYDRLCSEFGRESVFMDVDTIPFGVDFREHIDSAVRQADVLLAVIGEQWLEVGQNGKRRLQDPADYVRIEIETALAHGIPVIPALIERAPMPREDELPSSIATLAYRNAIQINYGRDFPSHIERLVRGIVDALPNTGEREDPVLAKLTREVLVSHSSWELQRTLYELDAYLARHPHSVEGRLLKDRIQTAILRTEKMETPKPFERRYRMKDAPHSRIGCLLQLVLAGLLLYLLVRWIL